MNCEKRVRRSRAAYLLLITNRRRNVTVKNTEGVGKVRKVVSFFTLLKRQIMKRFEGNQSGKREAKEKEEVHEGLLNLTYHKFMELCRGT